MATLLMFQRSKNTWTVVLCTWLKPRDQAHKSGQTAYAVRRLETYLTVWYIPYQMMRILHDTASGLFAINDGSPGLCLSVSVDTVSTVIWVLHPQQPRNQPINETRLPRRSEVNFPPKRKPHFHRSLSEICRTTHQLSLIHI